MQRKVRRLAWQIQIAAVVLCLLIPERTMGQATPPPLTAPGRTQNTIGMMSIGTAASGVVKDVLVHEGSRVHAGQIMVTLSCGPLEAEAQGAGRPVAGGAGCSRPCSPWTSVRGNCGG